MVLLVATMPMASEFYIFYQLGLGILLHWHAKCADVQKIYFLSSLTYKNCHGHSFLLVCTQSATLKKVPSSYWHTKCAKNIIFKYLHLNHAKIQTKFLLLPLQLCCQTKTSSFFIVICKNFCFSFLHSNSAI